MRKVESPENYHLMASAYLAEIEKMNAEMIEYLSRHPTEPLAVEVA